MIEPNFRNWSKRDQFNELLKQVRHVRACRGGLKAQAVARARFFCHVALAGELNTLNNLSEAYAPADVCYELSERSLNPVFEDGLVSDMAVREIVRFADTWPEVASAIAEQWSLATLNQWRALPVPAMPAPSGQMDLFQGVPA